jgi:AraC family transcriptional regulator
MAMRGVKRNGLPEERRGGRSIDVARVRRVLDYIDANLDGDLSVASLARLANFSPCHFHRRFSRQAGIGIARQVRLLRLRRAALKLAFSPDLTITTIAWDAGFGNTESFARAFRRLHGQSPSDFRRAPRWAQRELRKVFTALPENAMNKTVDIVDFPPTRVAAVEYAGPPEQEYSAIMRLVAWRRENGVPPDKGLTLGVHYTDPASAPPQAYRIDVCVSYDGEIAANRHGVVAKEIAGGRYARIRHAGSREHIPEARYVYEEWLPASGETPRDLPPFFHYVNVGPDIRDQDMITDVYVPIL